MIHFGQMNMKRLSKKSETAEIKTMTEIEKERGSGKSGLRGIAEKIENAKVDLVKLRTVLLTLSSRPLLKLLNHLLEADLQVYSVMNDTFN